MISCHVRLTFLLMMPPDNIHQPKMRQPLYSLGGLHSPADQLGRIGFFQHRWLR